MTQEQARFAVQVIHDFLQDDGCRSPQIEAEFQKIYKRADEYYRTIGLAAAEEQACAEWLCDYVAKCERKEG